jgi:hypothetical protein
VYYLRNSVSLMAMTTLMHTHRLEKANADPEFQKMKAENQAGRYRQIFGGEPYQPVFG